MKSNKTAIIYIRVSTSKQKQQWDSLRDQERKCRIYCKDNNMKVLSIFEDDFTWTSIQRPWLEGLFNYLESWKKVDYCIIKHIDRSSRWGVNIYEDIKNHLLRLWVQLRDVFWVIQDRQKIIKEVNWIVIDYDFCYSEPSKISETVTAISSQEERNQILRRTIPREMELEGQWYHVRNSVFWYTNKKIKTESWKKTIQVKDPIIWDMVIELFQERAKWVLSDQDIVDNINTKWLRTCNNKIITVKYFQTIIKKPIYAWVIISKWSDYIPIKTAYQWLVDMDTWNKANKGKLVITEDSKWKLCLIDSKLIDTDVNIQKRRKKFDENLPFRNLIESSQIPGQLISWSFSNPKRNKPTWYYHPIRIKGQKGENIKKEIFEDIVTSLFKEIQVNKIISTILKERFDKIFKHNKEKVNQDINIYKKQLQTITSTINNLEEKIYNTDPNLSRVLTIIEKKLTSLEEEKLSVENKIQSYKTSEYSDPENFKKFCFYVIEHISDLLIQSKNHEELSTLFKFVFKKTPTYNEINNRTFHIHPVFALNSKKEPSKIESSFLNLKWQPH